MIIVGPDNEEENSSPSNGLAELQRVFGDGNTELFLNCINGDNRRQVDNPSISRKEQHEDEENKNSDIDCEELDND